MSICGERCREMTDDTLQDPVGSVTMLESRFAQQTRLGGRRPDVEKTAMRVADDALVATSI